MNIEPLKEIINITTNKKNTILYFLSDELKNLLNDYELIKTNEFYLNDKIICIKKNNLKKEYNGKIICFDNDIITIKQNNIHITFNYIDYYIFFKKNISLKNDRQFFESLLEKL
jgi:hypothetical protein